MVFTMNKLREIRKKQNMTLEELAKKVGCSSRAIGYYERGERIPPTDISLRISKILDKSIEEIFGI